MSILIYPNWPAPAHILAFTTLRSAGNFALHVEDDPRQVLANRERLKREYALASAPYWLNQTHGDRVIILDKNTLEDLPEADGSYTRTPEKVCAVLTADCLPVLLCDSKGQEVAALHAGWKGLLANILERGVACFSCAPKEILVWLGPAIGPKAFEVGPEVYTAFVSAHADNQHAFIQSPKPGHFYLDIYALAQGYLQRLGVTQIYGGEYCTFTDARRFYSYRRDGKTGRMVTLIGRAII